VNDDEHSIFMALDLVNFTYNMWHITPESNFQIIRGSWGTQQIWNGSV